MFKVFSTSLTIGLFVSTAVLGSSLNTVDKEESPKRLMQAEQSNPKRQKTSDAAPQADVPLHGREKLSQPVKMENDATKPQFPLLTNKDIAANLKKI